MELSRPQLLHGREWYFFFLFSSLIFLFSLLIEYQNYTQFTKFSDTICDVHILSQYKKKKKNREYYVLKAALKGNIQFYTTANLSIASDLEGKRVKVWLLTKSLSFFDYLQSFYLPSKILEVYEDETPVKNYVKNQHLKSQKSQELYQALFFAVPISKDLREVVSGFGVSHLIAISGFHIGILTFLLFAFLGKPLQIFYSHYFPYRNYNQDIFFIVAFVLLVYIIYLHAPASLLRAFVMLIIAYLIYDRGLKVVSMQTLIISVTLLIALFPRLLFSLGFFLSVSGVFYIFLYLESFKRVKNRVVELVFISIWIYLMMLPLSIYYFHTFSWYHPFSIILSIVFTLFYPIMLFLHLLGLGGIFDAYLETFLSYKQSITLSLNSYIYYLYLLVSVLSYKVVYLRYVLALFSLAIFAYALSYFA